MLSALITSKNRRDLLTLFLTHPSERFYQKQLMRDLGISSSRIQVELGKLEGAGFLTSVREGNTRYFQVNKNCSLYPDLRNIIYKTVGLADLLRERLTEIGSIEVALIYGSVAKDIEDACSDIDLMVIGDVDLDVLNRAVDAAEAAIGREIDTVTFSRADWESRIASSRAFASDVLAAAKIFLIGTEEDLRTNHASCSRPIRQGEGR